MKRILVIFGVCGLLVGGSAVPGWTYAIDEQQNKRLDALESKLKAGTGTSGNTHDRTDLEARLKKLEDAVKAPGQKGAVKSASPAIEDRLRALEKKNAELEERLKLGSTPTVLVGKGVLTVNGVLQTAFSSTEDPASTVKTSFTLKRVRLIFSGAVVPDRVKYFVQTEMVQYPAILDTKLAFYYIPRTELVFGRLIPSFSYYMPISVAKLDFVNYPLVVTNYNLGRQVGLQSTTKFDLVDLMAGAFNGYPANNLTDNNTAKDLFFGANLRIPRVCTLMGYGWQGNNILGSPSDDKKERYGGGLLLDQNLSARNAVSFKGEYIAGFDRTGLAPEVRSAGFYSQATVKYNQKVEVLFRYEQFDANMNVTGDGITWLTYGLNYYLSGLNTAFYLNYINKLSEKRPDPQDDEILFQAQVSF